MKNRTPLTDRALIIISVIIAIIWTACGFGWVMLAFK